MNLIKKTVFCVLFLLATGGLNTAFAVTEYPLPGWQVQPNPFASPYAERGGQISMPFAQYPPSVNYYLSQTLYASIMTGLMYETLLSQDPLTMDYIPGLANKWTVSDDGTVFTFTIDPNAYWSDGVKITAHDVVWTYDMVVAPTNLTGPFKMQMMQFERPEALSDDTVKFTARQAHWKNLLIASGIVVLPKHAYENTDFNKINFEFPVVSGPYEIESLQEGIKITFKRRDNWWAGDYACNQNLYNFDRLVFYFFADQNNAFDSMKKGLVDFYAVYSARLWADETKGDRFSKNWIVKQKVYNFDPPGFQGFSMNMRAFPFDDVNVRKAVTLLLDRQELNETLMYNQYFLQRSYFEDLYDKNNPCPNPLYTKDEAQAKELLTKAGYKANPQTGWLEKDGKRLSFKFLTYDGSSANILAIYAEALKNAGIELVVDQKDWAAWGRDMDEFNFQMSWNNWTGSVYKDPEVMWSGKEADAKSGSNITGFKNARVDELIEKQRTIFDIQKRNEILREIDGILFNEHPYVLLWNINYSRFLYWNKFGMPDTVFSKYGNFYDAIAYWWYDEVAALELEDAQKSGLALPPKPYEVYFEEVFTTE